MTNGNNKTSVTIKTLALWMGILATVFVWGMTVQALLGNVRMNANAIEQLDDLKANKVMVQAQLDALIVRVETLRETMNTYLKHIDEKLVDIQAKIDKLAIKENDG